MEKYIQRINAVINTLNAATLRADQINAVQRIDACTRELKAIMQDLAQQEQSEKG